MKAASAQDQKGGSSVKIHPFFLPRKEKEKKEPEKQSEVIDLSDDIEAPVLSKAGVLPKHDFFMTPKERLNAKIESAKSALEEDVKSSKELAAAFSAGKNVNPFLLPKKVSSRKIQKIVTRKAFSAPLFPPAELAHVAYCPIPPAEKSMNKRNVDLNKELVYPSVNWSLGVTHSAGVATYNVPDASSKPAMRTKEDIIQDIQHHCCCSCEMYDDLPTSCMTMRDEKSPTRRKRAEVPEDEEKCPRSVHIGQKEIESIVSRYHEERVKFARANAQKVRTENTQDPAIIDYSIDTQLWIDMFFPWQSDELCGNWRPVSVLLNWLHMWRNKEIDTVKRQKVGPGAKWKKNQVDLPVSGMSGRSLKATWSKSPPSEHEDVLCNTMIISGPSGCGKTAAVYACASELGFSILEINASSQRYTGRELAALFGEATQSYALDESMASESRTLHHTNNSSLQSLILIEGIDTLAEADKGLLRAVQSFSTSSKRPIVIVCNEIPVFLRILGLSCVHIEFGPPHVDELVLHCRLICLSLGYDSKDSDIRWLVNTYGWNMRAIIVCLQFWMSLGGLPSLDRPTNTAAADLIETQSEIADLHSMIDLLQTGELVDTVYPESSWDENMSLADTIDPFTPDRIDTTQGHEWYSDIPFSVPGIQILNTTKVLPRSPRRFLSFSHPGISCLSEKIADHLNLELDTHIPPWILSERLAFWKLVSSAVFRSSLVPICEWNYSNSYRMREYMDHIRRMCYRPNVKREKALLEEEQASILVAETPNPSQGQTSQSQQDKNSDGKDAVESIDEFSDDSAFAVAPRRRSRRLVGKREERVNRYRYPYSLLNIECDASLSELDGKVLFTTELF